MLGTAFYKVEKVVQKSLIFLIRAYQLLISSWTKKNCRFYPTCSAYAKESLQTHGVVLGLYFTLRRLLRCHPFYTGGFDPIPEKRLKKHGH